MSSKVGRIVLVGIAATVVLVAPSTYGHPQGTRGAQPLDWHTDQIARVVSNEAFQTIPAKTAVVEGRSCLVGAAFNFDVLDQYAFDIDETVELTLGLGPLPRGEHDAVGVSYDAGDRAFPFEPIQPPAAASEAPIHDVTLPLARARFANLGAFGTDFSIVSFAGTPITVCDVRLERSYATPVPRAFGRAVIELLDAQGRPVAARVGLFDDTGRMPLPNEQAVAIPLYEDRTRMPALRPAGAEYFLASGGAVWPVRHRAAFYVDGRYEARLPAGRYELVVTRGPEHRIAHRSFTIEEDQATPVRLTLRRWDDLPARGWYSGDVHVHAARRSRHDDAPLLALMQAEDLHVANLLQMGNSGTVHFRQYGWDPVHDDERPSFLLTPGQEDPRTLRHGHTIHLNIREPVRLPERYLLYHEVFEATRAQGAVVGYAHVWDGSSYLEGLGHRRGLALDVPFGLVDFVEVLQMGGDNTDTWFDFLNLGYALTPAAGSDYPYIENVPGTVRSYVKVDGAFTSQAWFEGLKAGRTFVTNGPMLGFSVNGRDMGAQLELEPGDALVIEADATLNPDFGTLARLELIEQGEVVETVSTSDERGRLRLTYRAPARHGTWFVVRAHGSGMAAPAELVALSAPVYVRVGGESFWKPSAVADIATRLEAELRKMLVPAAENPELETWETRESDLAHWESQRPLLEQRIEAAEAIYDGLIERAARSGPGRAGRGID